MYINKEMNDEQNNNNNNENEEEQEHHQRQEMTSIKMTGKTFVRPGRKNWRVSRISTPPPPQPPPLSCPKGAGLSF